MKKNFLLLAILFLYVQTNTTAQECLPEGIKFITQGQIDSFPINHPGCFGIKGDVVIEERISGTIHNLDGLSQISSIGGNLKIWKNEALISLRGLDNISSIPNSLYIQTNSSLLSLEGLEKLESIKGAFLIADNDLLPNLSGLANLASISKRFLISNNNSLLSFSGLKNLISVDGCLSIQSNNNLSKLDGLESLTSISKCLDVQNNSSLENFNSLGNLTTIGTYLKVKQNESLISLSGLNNIVYVGGYMDVFDNPSLTDMKELKNLYPVGKKVKRKKKKKNYNVWISSIDKSSKYKGYLRGIEDSTIVLSTHTNKFHNNYRTQHIDVNNIKTFKYRKKGKIGKSILYGALAGFTVGAVIGLSSGNDTSGLQLFNAGETALIYGALLTIPGALIGGLIGVAKVKIPINGNHKTMKNQKGKLLDIMLLE